MVREKRAGETEFRLYLPASLKYRLRAAQADLNCEFLNDLIIKLLWMSLKTLGYSMPREMEDKKQMVT